MRDAILVLDNVFKCSETVKTVYKKEYPVKIQQYKDFITDCMEEERVDMEQAVFICIARLTDSPCAKLGVNFCVAAYSDLLNKN